MLTIPLYDDNPTVRTPVVTIAFIAANVLVFLWQLGWTPREEVAYSYTLGFVPALFFGSKTLPAEVVLLPSWATIFTSMFLHGGFMHIAGNMLFLWIFGNNVEDAVGRGRFLLFYLLCGTAAEQVEQEEPAAPQRVLDIDRKSTRLNSSHVEISYAVFC